MADDFEHIFLRQATDTTYEVTHHPVNGVYYCYGSTSSMLAMAFCLTDREQQKLFGDWEMAMVARYTQLQNKPMALEYYDHYLDNTGEDKYVDIIDLFNDNPYIKNVFNYRVRERLDRGILEGKNYNSSDDLDVDIPQAYYSDEDWWFALGSINLEWTKKDDNTVWVYFSNEYRWHPDEPRVSQSLHKALDNLQKHNLAKNFMMVGKPVLVTIPPKPVKPPNRNNRPEGNR
jgi:hypothetical protein